MAAVNISDSKTSLETLTFVCNVAIDGSLSVAGTICNALSIYVLRRDTSSMSVTVLLQGLAWADILFLLYTFLYTTLRSVYPYTGALSSYHQGSPYIIAIVLPIGWIAQTAGIWHVVLVAVDRFVAICFPFHGLRWCTKRRATISVVIAWTAAVVFNFPRFFYYHQRAFHDDSNSTSGDGTFVAHGGTSSPFWQLYRVVYHISLTIIFLFAVPLPLLMILNIRLIRAIHAAKFRQRHLAGAAPDPDVHGVTVNLIVIVSVFIVCQTPDFIASIIALEKFSVDQTFMSYYLVIREMLLVLDSSINFFIYCLFYRKFRRTLRRLVCRWCIRRGVFPDTTSVSHHALNNSSGNATTVIPLTSHPTNSSKRSTSLKSHA